MINRDPIKLSAEGPASATRLHEILNDPSRLPEWSSLAAKVNSVTGDTVEAEAPGGSRTISYEYEPARNHLVIRTKRDTFPQQFSFEFRDQSGKVRIDAEIFPGGEITDNARAELRKSVEADLARLIQKARG